jgi:hypothetical protein
VSFTPTPPAKASTAARDLAVRSAVAALSSKASARNMSRAVSLWAPPTASTSNTGLSPRKAAAKTGERPRRLAAPAVSPIAVRLQRHANAFSAHSPPATPSGTVT